MALQIKKWSFCFYREVVSIADRGIAVKGQQRRRIGAGRDSEREMSAGMTSKRLKGFCFTWVGREREREAVGFNCG